MQEDLLQPRLTVQESLSYAARLKIGQELSTEDKNKAVSMMKSRMSFESLENTLLFYQLVYGRVYYCSLRFTTVYIGLAKFSIVFKS